MLRSFYTRVKLLMNKVTVLWANKILPQRGIEPESIFLFVVLRATRYAINKITKHKC